MRVCGSTDLIIGLINMGNLCNLTKSSSEFIVITSKTTASEAGVLGEIFFSK